MESELNVQQSFASSLHSMVKRQPVKNNFCSKELGKSVLVKKVEVFQLCKPEMQIGPILDNP